MSVEKMAILTDVTKCIGCEQCVTACQQVNHLPPERPWRWLRKITDLSSARWTMIKEIRTDKGRRFVRRQCRHCLEPACVEACIVGALTKTPQGAVVYDADKCIGCRYCMVACPWEIPKYSWEKRTPLVEKCTFCYERVTGEGKLPACVEACPTKATIFGNRDALLAEAHRRIEAEPDRYVQKVWGEHEVGGTSVLYISDVDLQLDELVAPVTDDAPVPERTFKVLSRMPAVFVAMAGIMGATYWTIERRNKRMAESAAHPAKDAKSDSSGDSDDKADDGGGKK
jgi:formate dehydrogenase iron-sulfur subunit